MPLELVVCSWKIKENKTISDYATFGLDFSKLERNTFVFNSEINKKLALYVKSSSNISGDSQITKLRNIGVLRILEIEIFRYFHEQNKDLVFPEIVSEGIKIPSKASQRLNTLFGLGILVFILGSCVASMTSLEPAYNSQYEYNQYVIKRTGVGSTIDSAQELVDVCKVILRDKGMSRSQANRRCN